MDATSPLTRSHEFNRNYRRNLHVIFDNNFEVTSVTEKTAQALGFRSWENFIGKTVFDIRSPSVELAPQFYLQDKSVIRSGKELTFFNINTFCKLGTSWHLTHKCPIIDKNGNTIGINMTSSDVAKKNILTSFCLELYKISNHIGKSRRHHDLSYEIIDKYTDHGLTKQQSAIVFLLAFGKTTKEIANILGCNVRTVSTHCEHIKHRLNLDRKSQICEYVNLSGLLYQIPAKLIYRKNSDKMFS